MQDRRSVPRTLIEEFGQPVSTSDSWASWRCPNPKCHSRGTKYTTLLYSMKSGTLFCTMKCGLRRSPKQLGLGPTKIETPGFTLTESCPRPVVSWTTVGWASHEQHWDYLRERGMTPDEIATWVLFNPEAPRYVAFPVYEDGEWVTWHARAIDPGNEKRWISPSPSTGWASTKECVWGIDRMMPDDTVWVCEGIFDALYFPAGVAVMGINVTRTQILKILDRQPSRVILVKDGDDERIDAQLVAPWRKCNRYANVVVKAAPAGEKDYGALLPYREDCDV